MRITSWDNANTKWVSGASALKTLDALTDVVAPSPSANHVLMYNGSVWVNATAPVGASTLDSLTDVSAAAPSPGDVLIWNSTSMQWETGAAGVGSLGLDNLSDVVIANTAANHVLMYNGTMWVNATAPAGATTLDGLTDVVIANAVTNHTLVYNGTMWINQTPSGGGTLTLSQRLVLLNLVPGTQTYPIFLAPEAATVIRVRAVQIGTGTCTVNVTNDGVEVGSDLAPGASPTWAASAVVSSAVTAGKALAVEVKSVVGTISYLVVQVDYTQSS